MWIWRRSRDPKAQLRELVGDYELPSFSTAAVSTLGLLREGADMGVVAQRIMTDPGLSVRILQAVNSAAFGVRCKVANLQYATSLLGRARVESLVLTAAVAGALPRPAGLDLEAFWRTSACRACLARALAERSSPPTAMESFTGGLLQDMAIPLMLAARPEAYSEVLDAVTRDPERALRAEEDERLGYNHAQVGAVMAEGWDLPEVLITAIADHHHPGEGAPPTVEAVSHVPHGDASDRLEPLFTYCHRRLGVPPDELGVLIESAHDEANALVESMVGAA